MSDALDYLLQNREGDLIPWSIQVEASERFALSLAEIETIALDNELLPARYQRNRSMLSVSGQRRLFRSTVAVVGCGGLGGYVLEELARLGIGRIVAIDPDIFVEHNLNRQLLSSPGNLGEAKADAAAQRVALINPAVSVTNVQEAFAPDNAADLLQGADVVVDCLDSVDARLSLAQACTQLKIPLVHGAIAGWYGHICTVFPGDRTLEQIYARETSGKGIEQSLGNPSYTPAVVASLEVAEVCKVLLSEGTILRNRMMVIDLLEMDFEQIAW